MMVTTSLMGNAGNDGLSGGARQKTITLMGGVGSLQRAGGR